MFKQSIIGPITVVLVIAVCPLARAQTWTYQGNSSCFHSGSNVQCFESGTLRSYATNKDQFEASYRNGQAIGQGIGLLIQAWLEHRRQVEIERKDIREQINAVYHATYELNDEVMRYENALTASYYRLGQLDPPRRSMYEDAAKTSEGLSAHLAQMKPMTEKNLPGILAAKDVKFLKSNLELSQKFYSQAYEAAKKEYVFSQFLSAFVGYLEFHQGSSSPAVTVAATKSAATDNDITHLPALAEAGDADAQVALGKMYRDGRGVPQSYANAAKWFRLAAAQGNPDSQVAMGELFQEGRGVVQDFVQAHMWFNLAAAAGVPGAEARRNSLAAKMTPEQLAEAQKLASHWKSETRTK